LCVTACPEGALHMEKRENPTKVYKNNDALNRSIYAESAIGLLGRTLGLKK
jgi:ferredoxin